MAVRLKSARSAEERADGDAKVREMVERALDDIARRGDVAVREMSARFDSWNREDFRLTGAEIDACLAQLSEQDLDDIRFAQAQVCNFAQVQKACLLDFEAETLPGVVLGHRNIPVASSGCYVPGGKYPLLASAHMSAVTAKVAGCGRIVTCAPPFKDKPAPAIVAAQRLAGADEIWRVLLAAVRARRLRRPQGAGRRPRPSLRPNRARRGMNGSLPPPSLSDHP